MDISRFEEKLSLLPWTKTKVALNDLCILLKCNICQKLPMAPHYIGTCDHFYCNDCISEGIDNSCPVCRIPCTPAEKKPSVMIQGLVSSVRDLSTIINGGTLPEILHAHEAPDLPSTGGIVQNGNTAIKEPDSLAAKEANMPQISKSLSAKASPVKRKQNAVTKPKIGKHVKANDLKTSKKPTDRKKKQCDILSSGNVRMGKEKVLKTSNKTLDLKKTQCDSLNSKSNLMQTPNMKACLKSKLLPSLNSPATPLVNKRNVKGETVLHATCIKGDLDKVNNLLEQGFNPNTKDNAGWTPLHEACSNGNVEIASLLLEHGALVGVPGRHNMTPLHDAVLSQALDIIVLLRKWGASDIQRDIWGRTSRSLADLTNDPDKIHAALDTPHSGQLVAKRSPGVVERKWVFLDSGLPGDSKKKLEKFAKLAKAKFASEFNDDVTHVVVHCDGVGRTCSRTLKYLMAVTAGKWVVSSLWVDECLAVEKYLDPAPFEVEGSRLHPDSDASRKGRCNMEKMLPGILSGLHVYFSSPIKGGESVPPKRELEYLVRIAGGEVIQREPNPESIEFEDRTVPFHASPESALGACSHLCIYPEGLQEPPMKYDMPHIKTLPLSWLYDSLDCWNLLSPQLYKEG